ncbi:MAG: hypothetical protein K0Q72_4914, partial [Armatimonadetes bacterium]|nr:hypothetical protein [Armatimonadota bacterium]
IGRWTPPARAGAPAAPGRDWLLRVDAPRNSMKPLFALPPNTALLASPREPLAVLWGIDDGSVRVLKSDGTLLRQVAPPAGMTAVLPRWAADGRILAMGITRPSDDAQAPRPAPVNLALELSSGGFIRLDKPLPEPPAGPDLTLKELVLTGTQAVLQSGSVRQAVSPLWLVATAERAESRALVSANAQSGTLSPRGDAVLLISDGAALIAPLIRLPKEALLAARNQAMRQKVLSNGKQLGLALHVYASDHEDRFPDAGAGVEGLLLPYLKTDALFEGFVYTYTGGKISEIPEPSKVVLGYVMGPGGRAEIWGDGHVTWKDDQ